MQEPNSPAAFRPGYTGGRRVLASSKMALGDLTKQLAEQALRNVGKASAQSHQPEGSGMVILAQVQAMQKALKEDEELLVLFHAGTETLRIVEFFVPSPQVFVLTGLDRERNVVRVISASDSLQLVCKVAKAAPGSKAARVNVVLPKPKPE